MPTKTPPFNPPIDQSKRAAEIVIRKLLTVPEAAVRYRCSELDIWREIRLAFRA